MSTHLSRHFEEKRLAKGLKPSHLARLVVCQNVLKNGNRIRTFELTGDINKELLDKIAAALEIAPATIERLVEQDRRDFFEQWLKWVSEPITPYLVVRLMAAVYSKRSVPREITEMDQAERWAANVAGQEKRRCCLVWSRRISCWFDQDGTLCGRSEAVPGEPNLPCMKIGGKRFLFDDGLRSVSMVECQKSE